MEIVRKDSTTSFSNSGVQSEQLLFPENSSSRRVTLTRVTVLPGATNPPHRHPASGRFGLRSKVAEFSCSMTSARSQLPPGRLSVSRTATCMVFIIPDVPFVYLSVTAPPVNFREAYSRAWTKTEPARVAMKNRP